MILELWSMILALAIIDEAGVVIYATIWSVIYDCKFTILYLLEYKPQVWQLCWTVAGLEPLLSPPPPCGLYYKNIMIVNDASRIISEWCHNMEHLLQSSIMHPCVVIYAPRVSCQTVVEQLLDSCRTVVEQLLDSCRTVVGQLLDSCRTVVGQLSDSCRTVVRQLSDSCQTVVRQLSDSCQTVVRQLSNSFQSVVRQLSDSCWTDVGQL